MKCPYNYSFMSFTQFNIQLYLIYVYQKNLFNIYVFFNLNIIFINKFSLYKKPKKKKSYFNRRKGRKLAKYRSFVRLLERYNKRKIALIENKSRYH